MANSKKTAVLLLAHGSPDSVDQVPDFLLRVTGGRPLPQPVVDEVKHRYGLIGRSPLTELTLKQAERLGREMGMPVYVGMRNWNPFIADAVNNMVKDGIEYAVAICLAPQNSRTSVGLYRSALADTGTPFTVDFVESWHDQPALIRAFAEKLRLDGIAPVARRRLKTFQSSLPRIASPSAPSRTAIPMRARQKKPRYSWRARPH